MTQTLKDLHIIRINHTHGREYPYALLVPKSEYGAVLDEIPALQRFVSANEMREHILLPHTGTLIIPSDVATVVVEMQKP